MHSNVHFTVNKIGRCNECQKTFRSGYHNKIVKSYDTILRDEVMKELLDKVLRSRICVLVLDYKDKYLSRSANKDGKLLRRQLAKTGERGGRKAKKEKVSVSIGLGKLCLYLVYIFQLYFAGLLCKVIQCYCI
jgi:hypothetical protein